MTATTNPDGTVDTVTTVRYNDREIAVTTKQDANGDVIGTPTRSLLLHDVDPSLVAGLYELSGQAPPADLGRDLRLDFSEAQLRELQSYALDELADRIALNGRRPSAQEIPRSLRENHGVIEFDGAEYDFGGLDSELGAAQTPNDMLIALYHGGESAGAALNNLELLIFGHTHGLPATIKPPSC